MQARRFNFYPFSGQMLAGGSNHLKAVPAPGEASKGRHAGRGKAPSVRTEQAPAGDQLASSDLVLGRYRLQRTLGTGGFATVWAARDERLEREVAVKVLRRDRVVFGRFEREARTAARLMHPAIVTLYEAAIDDGGAYLVSELVRGRTLEKLLETGRLSDRDVLAVTIAIGQALAHAHSEGVIHRDVKPSNILVPGRSSADGPAAKLTDFGVARLVDADSGGLVLTRTGDVIGTAAYMAPEQADGREAAAAADLYSLALVTYEALAGVNPLRGIRAGAGKARRPPSYLPPLRRQRRDLPPEIAAAIDQALRPRPRERGSIEELLDAAGASLDRVGTATGVVAPRGWVPTHTHTSDEPGPGREWADTQPRAAGPPAGSTREKPQGGDRDLAATENRWLRGGRRPLRAVNAAMAALVAWWLSLHLLTAAPLAPAAAGLIAAGAVLIAPRVGVLAGTFVLAGVALAQGRPGGAMALVLVVGLTALSMPLAASTWALPAGAVLLGAVSLGGAWPAIVARSGARLWQRAAVSGAGFVWLAVAGTLTGVPLYTSVSPRPPSASAWTGSVELMLHGVLIAMLQSGVPAAAVVWAAAAVVGPMLITGRTIAGDLVVATVWSAITLAGTELAIRLFSSPGHYAEPRGAVIGAIAGALILLAPAMSRRGRAARVTRRVP